MVIILVSLAVIMGVYLILQDFRTRALKGAVDPFLWIPSESEIIIHIRKPALFSSLLIEAEALTQLSEELWSLERASGFLQRIDSLAAADEQVYSIWSGANITIGIQPAEKNIVVQFNFHPDTHPKIVTHILKGQLFTGTHFREGHHNNENIYIYSDSAINTTWYMVLRQNALVVSTATTLMGTDNVEKQSTLSIITDSDFQSMRSVAGQYSDNVYVRQRALCRWLPGFISGGSPLSLNCNGLTGWQMWDISSISAGVFLSGFALGSKEDFGALLTEPSTPLGEIKKLIPLHPAILVYFNTGHLSPIGGKDYRFSDYHKRFNDITGLTRDSIAHFWSGELAWVVNHDPIDDSPDQGVVILGVRQVEDLIQHQALQLFISEANVIQANDIVYSPLIYASGIPGFFPMLTNGLLKENFNYFSIYNDYIIAAASASALYDYMNSIRFGLNFTSADDYSLMQEFLQEGQSLFFYRSARLKASSGSDSDVKNHYHSFTLQMLPSAGGMNYSSALWLHGTHHEISNPLLWELKLDAPVMRGPARVINHNDGSSNYMVQDVANTLYLIDDNGAILWKKELSGPVMSDFFQVDFLKNKRLQFLFNTRNYLHLIDRNANYLPGYPMRLPQAAVAGVSVFDYDNTRNYRVMIPSENKTVLNYSLNRRSVTGWQFKPLPNGIRQPLQFFRLNNKDYIVAIDTTGTIHFFDRQGKPSLKTRQKVQAVTGSSVYAHSPAGANAHFLIAGDKGMLYQVMTDGRVNTFSPDTLASDFVFAYETLTRDHEADLIFFNNGNLSVFNIASKKVFSTTVQREMNASISIFDLKENGRFVGLTDKDNRRLFIINREGEIHPGFPMEGDTPFVMEADKEGRGYIITGVEDKIRKYAVVLKKQ
jgi:hypothetical protein